MNIMWLMEIVWDFKKAQVRNTHKICKAVEKFVGYDYFARYQASAIDWLK